MSISLPQFYGSQPKAPTATTKPNAADVATVTPQNGTGRKTASDTTVAWSWVWMVGLLILARVVQEYAGDVV